MSGFDDLLAPRPVPAATPGRGGSAADFGRAPVPGKDTRSGRLGEAWVMNGSPCDGQAGRPDCFLDDGQRGRLTDLIQRNFQTAASNYKLALHAVELSEHRKQEDLPWLAALALDVAGGFLLKKLTQAAVNARTKTSVLLSKIITKANVEGNYEPFALRAESALRAVSTKQLENGVKVVFEQGKRAASRGLTHAWNNTGGGAQQAMLPLIEQLWLQVDPQFMKFCYDALARSTDAELIILWDQSDPLHHSKAAYELELRDKLERFRNSGVNGIGRRLERDDSTAIVPAQDVQRDRRVVWVQHMSGVRELWYQTQDGARGVLGMVPGAPSPAMAVPERRFGPPDPHDSPTLERRVPDEFADVALARSEQRWGPTPVVDPPEVMVRKEIAGRRGWLPELVDRIVEQ